MMLFMVSIMALTRLLTMVMMIVLKIVIMMVLIMVMMLLKSTSHISHKQLIDSDDNGVDDSVEDGDNSYEKHLTHLSQAAACCLKGRSKQLKHAVCDKDNDVDD
eukprot:10863083-Ditylum_brightwellii.AAC.1